MDRFLLGEPENSGVIEGFLNQPLRTERLIAAARVCLALVFLLALAIDPSEPIQYAKVVFGLTVVYLLASSGVLVWLKMHDQLPTALPLWIQGIEMLWIAALSVLSNGPASPFVIAFIFTIFASAYRWRLNATLLTGLLTVLLMFGGALLLLAPPQSGIELHGNFRINRLMMRAFYLLLTAGFAGLLSESQKRLFLSSVRVTNLLAGIDLKGRFSATLQRVLQEVASQFGSQQAILWVEQVSTGRAFEFEVSSDGREAGLSALWRESSTQMKQDLRFALTEPLLVERNGAKMRTTSLNPQSSVVVAPGLLERLGVASVVIAPVEVEDWRGKLLLLAPRLHSEARLELRALKELLQHVMPAVFNVYLSRKLHARATAIERTRVARELHDGSIQSLISLGMQIDIMRKNTPGLTPEIAQDLQRVQGLVRQEVLNLRALMTNLQTVEVGSAELVDFVAHLVEQWKRETGIEATFFSQADELILSPRTCKEIARIVQEALTNVRKHSGARLVSVRMLSSEEGLELIIQDDGRGFGFEGRLDQQELRRARRGPAILGERVRAIGGSLAIDSTQGARLEITIPYVAQERTRAAQV
jgi:signal transduction histidine kinase